MCCLSWPLSHSAVEDAWKQNEQLQRENTKLTEEWTAERQKHARVLQCYDKQTEQNRQLQQQQQLQRQQAAMQQPTRVSMQPVSPMMSPASEPSLAQRSVARNVQPDRYPTSSQGPIAAASALTAAGGPGWDSSSHGELDYARHRDGSSRAVQHPAAAAEKPYQSYAAVMMPAQLESEQERTNSRRRPLPLHSPSSSRLVVSASEPLRYGQQPQRYRSSCGGHDNRQLQQHGHGHHTSKKKRGH